MRFRIEIKTNNGTIVEFKTYKSWRRAEAYVSKFAQKIDVKTYSIYRTK